MRWEYQLINVPDYQGVGEYCPRPHFFQNLGEAEYAVALYQYLRSRGHSAASISILTTYKVRAICYFSLFFCLNALFQGQKDLLVDILERRCGGASGYGMPGSVSTVDKYQGQQNEIVILSLVRSKHVGHLRDARRLVVAVSRAKRGLYILARQTLFQNCYELTPGNHNFLFSFRLLIFFSLSVFEHLLARPTSLQVVPGERVSSVSRLLSDPVPDEAVRTVASLAEMGQLAAAGFDFEFDAASVVKRAKQ